MRKLIALVVGLAVSATLVGCGDKGGGGGGGGPAGTWVADVEQLLESAIAEQSKDMTAEQKAAGLEPMKQMMRNMLKDAKLELVLSGDGTASLAMSGFPGEASGKGTGTWTQTGDKVVVTPKTKDGKPVEGADAKPMDLVFKDGVLSLKPDEKGPAFRLRRK